LSSTNIETVLWYPAEYFGSIRQRFLAIDVKKTYGKRKKGKTQDEALDIHNKIKIITLQDAIFELLPCHSCSIVNYMY
jgi:hypothetical protein